MYKAVKLCASGMAVMLAVAGCGGCSGQNQNLEARSDRPIKLIAHRGESIYAPENTVPSYQLAWRNGACWGAETDVYLTKDNVLVCMHDSTTDRTARVPGKIREMTLEELRRLDVGKWKGAQWLGIGVPTLREVFETIPADKHIFVEIKSAGEGFAKAYEEARLGGGVRDDQVSIISFSGDELKHVRRDLPHVRTLWLLGINRDKNGVIKPSAEELIATLTELDVTGADAYPGDDLCVDAEYIQKVKDAGFEFHVWTINSTENALTMFDRGADSITTDCSAKLYKEMTEAMANRKAQE